MLKKFSLLVSGLVLLVFFFSCGGSGQYDIKKGNYADTLYKSTGAKLKGTFKIRTVPKLTIQIAGGLNLGMAELSSDYSTTQFIEGQNFGVKNGFGFMVTGKIPVHKEGNVRLNFTGAYSRFQSDFLASRSPFGKTGFNVLSFGIGVENSFSPALKIKPYVAAELQANFISGSATINDVSNGTIRNVKIKNSFRIGYMVYSGLEFMLNNKVGLNLGLKVTNANQVLKSSNTDSDPNEVSLRDKKVDNFFMEFAGFKNFTFTSFFVGVNLYFGIKDVLYKF